MGFTMICYDLLIVFSSLCSMIFLCHCICYSLRKSLTSLKKQSWGRKIPAGKGGAPWRVSLLFLLGRNLWGETDGILRAWSQHPALIWPQKKTPFASGTSCVLCLALAGFCHDSAHSSQAPANFSYQSVQPIYPTFVAFEISGINFVLKVSRSLAHLLGVFSLTKSIDVFWKVPFLQGNLVPHLESSARTFCRKRERYQSVRRRDTALVMDLVQPAKAQRI